MQVDSISEKILKFRNPSKGHEDPVPTGLTMSCWENAAIQENFPQGYGWLCPHRTLGSIGKLYIWDC